MAFSIRQPHCARRALRSILLPAVLALTVAGGATAQTAAASGEARVGVIDVQKLLLESVRGKQEIAKLKTLSERKEAEIKAKRDEVAALRARVAEGQLSLSEDKLVELDKELEDKTIALSRLQDDAGRELEKARNAAFKKIEEELLPIIHAVGAEGGYTLIFNKFQSGLLFALDEVDITALVLERYDAKAGGGS